MSIQIVSRTPFVRLLRNATSLFVFLTAGLVALAADTGRVAGTVVSKSTGNVLQGAQVTVQGRVGFSDESGRFVIYDVPAGNAQVVATYSGFKDLTQDIVIAAGGQSDLTLTLETSDIVMLEAFTVQTVKEGQALSVTEQRNAANQKNVVALDEWGVLPTQNVGELFARMPGISFTTDEDNLINNITVRGMVSSNGQSFTRLNIDGMSATGVGGNGRTATLHSFSAAMYEQLEVIAGQTPDKRADSIGGQINLKTRSPLAMNEKRRINYSLSGRFNPPTNKRNEDLGTHPYGYVATLGYREVFDVFGGKKNLGVSVDLAQQQIVTQFDYDFMQYSSVTDSNQVYFRDYDKRSGMNHRFITGIGMRADYRVSDSTTVSARFIYNSGREPYFHYTFVNPFFSTNNTIYDPVTNPSGGIVAGSNSTRTEIRPTGNAQLLLTPRRFSFMSNNPTGSLFFEHKLGRLKIDHAWRMSRTHWQAGAGTEQQGGQLTLRTKDPIGFILDNSNREGRVFTQTAGPSVYDPNSYASFVVTAANTTTAPVAQTSVRFDKRNIVTDTNEWSGNLNASYELNLAFPVTVKVGGDTITRKVDNFQVDPRRWYTVAGTVLSGLPLMTLTTFEQNQGGQRLPVYDPAAVSTTLGDTTKWYEDVNFNAVQKLTSSRHINERVDSYYGQAQAKLGKLTVLGGARLEDVSLSSWTYFRARTTAIAAQPDHYARAAFDFDRNDSRGGYKKLFPSAHLAYDITPNMKARASWSMSYSRPDLLQLVQGVTTGTDAQGTPTITVGNPGLKPQVAKNGELKLEYYFKNSGVLSASIFTKSITDYLPPSGVNFGLGRFTGGKITLSNGTEVVVDDPAVITDGAVLLTPRNIGNVKTLGFELDYKQRLTFLPGLFKGLTVRANYTYLQGRADLVFPFTNNTAAINALVADLPGNMHIENGLITIKRKTSGIPGLLQHSANLGLQYTKGKFGASYDLNYTGSYNDGVGSTISTFSVTAPAYIQLFVYRKPLTTMNAGVTYRLSSDATLFLNVNNFTEQGNDRYLQFTSRPRQLTITPLSMTFGVTGTF
ncbi:MAG: TonB-dependent receptor [Opitutae bacterium]|nr:TonB-dependent receptor [Opitutae bacterium]